MKVTQMRAIAAFFAAVIVAGLPMMAAKADTPPVRISITAGGGSGIEQDAADQISNQLSGQPNIVVSTVNPDWFVVCRVDQDLSRQDGSIRYNGTVTVKTPAGRVIKTFSVQKYNQDFSLHRGTPLNKALVDGAARDVISGMVERAVGPIEDAAQVEMQTRALLIQASKFASQGKYSDAIAQLTQVTQDSPHFDQARALISKYRARGGGRAHH